MWIEAGSKHEVTGQQYKLTSALNPAKVNSNNGRAPLHSLCKERDERHTLSCSWRFRVYHLSVIYLSPQTKYSKVRGLKNCKHLLSSEFLWVRNSAWPGSPGSGSVTKLLSPGDFRGTAAAGSWQGPQFPHMAPAPCLPDCSPDLVAVFPQSKRSEREI